MGLIAWLAELFFELVQSVGIIVSIWIARRTLCFDSRERRVGNRFKVNESYRQIWSELYERPELVRIRDPKPNLQEKPITVKEELFVSQLIHHLGTVFRASKEGVITPIAEIETDVGQLFAKPIPNKIWNQNRRFQDADFVEFVEDTLSQD